MIFFVQEYLVPNGILRSYGAVIVFWSLYIKTDKSSRRFYVIDDTHMSPSSTLMVTVYDRDAF